MLQTLLIWFHSFVPLLAEREIWFRALGDSGAGAWAITFGYLLAALACFLAALRQLSTPLYRSGHVAMWLVLGSVLLVLGINKQMDFQLLLFLEARRMAHEQGWYDRRHEYVATGAAVAGVVGLAGFAWLARLRVGLGTGSWLAMAGLFIVLAHSLVRAFSIGHLDQLFGTHVGASHYTMVEGTGLLLAFGGAAWEAFGRRRPKPRRKLRRAGTHLPPAS